MITAPNRIPSFTADASLHTRPTASLPMPHAAQAADADTVVPAMRCQFTGDVGFCCTASDYCCLWGGSGGPVCGQTYP